MRQRYTKEAVEEALKKSGGLASGAARILDCSVQTVLNYIKRFPELEEIRRDVVTRVVDKAEAGLFQLVSEGDRTSIIFTLKTLGRNRGYSERHEVTGKDGGPIQVDIAGIAATFERMVMDDESSDDE